MNKHRFMRRLFISIKLLLSAKYSSHFTPPLLIEVVLLFYQIMGMEERSVLLPFAADE